MQAFNRVYKYFELANSNSVLTYLVEKVTRVQVYITRLLREFRLNSMYRALMSIIHASYLTINNMLV